MGMSERPYLMVRDGLLLPAPGEAAGPDGGLHLPVDAGTAGEADAELLGGPVQLPRRSGHARPDRAAAGLRP